MGIHVGVNYEYFRVRNKDVKLVGRFLKRLADQTAAVKSSIQNKKLACWYLLMLIVATLLSQNSTLIPFSPRHAL